MDITLKEYKEILGNFTLNAENYIKYVNEYGFSGTYPNEYEIIEKNMKIAEKLSVGIDKPVSGIAESFKLFSNIVKIKRATAKIIEILKACEFKEDMQFSYSGSNKQFSYETYTDFADRLSNLEHSESVVTPDYKLSIIAEYLANALKLNKDAELHDIYKKYDKAGDGSSVVELYTKIIQNRIDEIVVSKGNEDYKKQINDYIVIIESLKTEALEHAIKVENGNMNINTIQKLIGRNNLIPSGELKPLAELFGVSNISSNFQKLTDKLTSLNNINIYLCVIYKITPNPMEHKLEPLISRTYLNEKNLFQTSDMGINEKIFIRTNTIVKCEGSTENTGKTIELYSPSRKSPKLDEKMFIIETLDGNNYRFLHLWDIDAKNYMVPTTWTKLLPEKYATPSKRLFYYNDIINSLILEYLDAPKIDINFMSRTEMAKSNTKYANIRTNIIKELDKKFNVGHNYAKLFTKKEFLASVLSIMANKMVDFDKFKNPIEVRELSISYVKDLDNINKRLERELKNAHEASPKASFSTIMDEVLSKFINSKSNLSATIDYKSKMLAGLLGTEQQDEEKQENY